MELYSDFDKTKNLLNTDTENITNIEFYEGSNQNSMDSDDEIMNGGSSQINEQDTYAKIQERGNRRADALSDERNWNYNVDIMDNEGSKRQRGMDTDFRMQFGGKDENLNYLDNYTSAQYDDKRLDSFQNDLVAIYNKALEFRKRIENIENRQKGGQTETNQQKPKKPLNPTIRLILDLNDIMRKSGKYPDIKPKYFMKISKMIIDDAKQKNNNATIVNEEVRTTALQLVKNPEPYVARFRKQQAEQAQSQQSQQSQGNYQKKNSRQRSTDRTSENIRSKNAFSNTDNTNKNFPWRGNDSNYRNYAQENLWFDIPEWKEKSSKFTESQKFSGDALDYFNSPIGSKYYSQHNETKNNRTRIF
jgi:hypothetical protein